MIRVLLLLNAVLIGGALIGVLFLAYVSFGFTGKVDWEVIAAGLLAGAVVTFTVLALGKPVPSYAPIIGLLSLPFYLFVARSALDDRAERQIARQFLVGDSTTAAEAAKTLANLGQRSGVRPAAAALLAGIKQVTDPARRATGLELLGKLVYRNDQARLLLADEFHANAPPNGRIELRRAAFAALGSLDPGDIRGVRFVSLESSGLVTLRLSQRHPVFGDSITTAIQGLILPHGHSADPCEQAAADRSVARIINALAPTGLADLAEIRLRPDGSFSGALRAPDGMFVHQTLRDVLPVVSLTDDDEHAVDWCREPPITRSFQRNGP